MPSAEQLRKLPAWAREEIRKSEQRAVLAERKLAERQELNEPTKITAGDVYGNPVYLPDDQWLGRVRFQLSDADRLSDFIIVQLGENQRHLKLQASRGLVIEMDASNTAILRLKEWP